MLAAFAFTVTARGCALHQFFELGQDHVQRLQRVHFQCALLEKMFQQIGRFVARHLQDAFVHCKHHGAGGRVAGEFHFDDLARLDQLRAGERDIGTAPRQTSGKRHHAIA